MSGGSFGTGGGGGGAASIAAGDITDVGATGEALVQAETAAEALAAAGLATAAPLTGTAGWTLRNGAGGATITSSVARLTLATGVATGSWSLQPAAGYPHGLDAAPPHFAIDARARLKAWTGGDSSSVYTSFSIRLGTAAADALSVSIRGNGGANAVFGYANVIGVNGLIGSAASVSRATFTSGQWWTRIVVVNSTIYCYHGTGSAGAQPTSWTLLGSSTNLTNVTAASIALLMVNADGSGGAPDDVTIDWDNISARLVGLA